MHNMESCLFSATRELQHGIIVLNADLLYSQGCYLRQNETKCNLLWSYLLVSFAGPFTVSEAHSLGMSSGTSDVCPSRTPSLRSDLTHFQVEQLHQTFRICLQGAPDYAHYFFWSKNFKGQRSRSKRSKTVKIYPLLQFLSQDVQIFKMCSPNHGQ